MILTRRRWIQLTITLPLKGVLLHLKNRCLIWRLFHWPWPSLDRWINMSSISILHLDTPHESTCPNPDKWKQPHDHKLVSEGNNRILSNFLRYSWTLSDNQAIDWWTEPWDVQTNLSAAMRWKSTNIYTWWWWWLEFFSVSGDFGFWNLQEHTLVPELLESANDPRCVMATKGSFNAV